MNLDFYKGKRVFITGHTGFKGTWLSHILIRAGAEVTGYSLPAPTEPSLFMLSKTARHMNSVIGDIRDHERLNAAFEAARPEVAFHLAAQPIVQVGYENPLYTYETNVMGTVNFLECVRTARHSIRSVVVITTDKVYENKEWPWGYRENEPLDGYDPYSNSKSCAELVAHCYRNSFLLESETVLSTARAGNVIGGGDFARDRIIPDCVRSVQAGLPILVRNPDSIRPYQHVLEPLSAYLMIAQRQYENGSLAGWYNVGPDEHDCVTTGKLVDLFCQSWGDGMIWENQAKANTPHEATLLKLDCSLLKTRLGWSPRWDIQTAVSTTVEWTKMWMDGHEPSTCMDRTIDAFQRNNGGR